MTEEAMSSSVHTDLKFILRFAEKLAKLTTFQKGPNKQHKNFDNTLISKAKLFMAFLFLSNIRANFTKTPPSTLHSVHDEAFLCNSEVRKVTDASEEGVASSSPTGQPHVAKWQSCCHGNTPLFQLSLAGSDRRVKPYGQPESRGLTPSWLCLLLMGQKTKRE